MLNLAFQETNLVMLVGAAGIGKTALAAQFAKQASYDLTLWLSSWRQRTLTDLAMEALRQLLLQVDETTSARQEDWTDLSLPLPWETAQAEIIEKLEDYRALVVLDNYDASMGHQAQEVSEFIIGLSDRLPASNFLVVGRARPSLGTAAELITLGPLDTRDARDLLEKTLPSSLTLNNPVLAQQVEKVTEVTEGNPLLIRLLATEVVTSEQTEDAPGSTNLEAYLDSILRYLDSSQRRALDVLAQFDEPVNIQDPRMSELFEQERITHDDIRNLSQTGLLSTDGTVVMLFHSVIRDYVRKRSPIRTTLRTNRTIARFYQEQGEYLRAANHLARADEPAEAVEAIADYVDEIINQGHASDAYKYLVDELSQVGSQPSVNLSRLIAAGSLATFMGDVHEAIQLYKTGLVIAQRLGDRRSESELLGRHVFLSAYGRQRYCIGIARSSIGHS